MMIRSFWRLGDGLVEPHSTSLVWQAWARIFAPLRIPTLHSSEPIASFSSLADKHKYLACSICLYQTGSSVSYLSSVMARWKQLRHSFEKHAENSSRPRKKSSKRSNSRMLTYSQLLLNPVGLPKTSW